MFHAISSMWLTVCGSAVHVLQLTVRDALNSALDEEMSRDPAVYILGEEVSPLICLCAAHWLLCWPEQHGFRNPPTTPSSSAAAVAPTAIIMQLLACLPQCVNVWLLSAVGEQAMLLPVM